ncbi:hypothetical protein [Kitasatospora purpeofusca]|uniref:hypothetical protein n=1 Tax=Kitasatospora purpeofusca TaxID=67352 RepID=UPI00386E4288
MRNGEALAVNINININVADDVDRITEQVNQTTKTYAPLKHRRAGDYRDVPLASRVRRSIEWYGALPTVRPPPRAARTADNSPP